MTQEFINQVLPLVIEEALNIKENATSEEIAKLDEDKVNGEDQRKCIYGLMTGHCNTDRAIELIKKCCTRVYNVKNWENRLNGHASDIHVGSQDHRHVIYLSPIELAISYSYGGKYAARNIIKFIKGEITEFTQKHIKYETPINSEA